MENYIVSARKYRPETFQTVVGQPSITTTLKNAIRNKQLAHAYLFCGPRGIGKTTCARIFAKTINCFNITDKTEACNKCESCLSFNSSRSFNIHELDAASNNSVEDIRSLIEQVRIPPQIAKYSIYIIDEVHMLSASAFNAFLKTLEEPPAHAIFILATTEKHKILPTILSRCQIFDFNRIQIEDIVTHLTNIAKAKNIEAESEGLNIIAQKADGAMRDALSIFDQIASFSAGKITYSNVIDNLNVLDYDYYFKITDNILEGNVPASLMIFDEILDKGFDGHNFINGLSRHFRDLLVCRDEITLQLLEVGASIRERYKAQSKNCSPDFLFNALSVTNQCDLSFRSSKNQRLHIELSLVQLCGLTTGEKKKSESQAGRLNKASQDRRSNKEEGSENTSSEQQNPETPAVQPDQKSSAEQQNPETPAVQPDQKSSAEQQNPETPAVQPDQKSSTEQQNPETSAVQSDQKSPAEQQNPETPAVQPDQKSSVGQQNPETPAVQPAPELATGKPDEVKTTTNQISKKESDKQETSSLTPNQKQAETGEVVSIEKQIHKQDGYFGNNSSNTISIKDVLKGTQPEPVIEPTEEPAEEPSEDDDGKLLVAGEETDEFTEKDLSEQWKKFANRIRNKHPRLYNTLLANKPTINSQTNIEFEISNPLQQEALNKIMPQLLGHLRRELNRNIDLKITINETLQSSRLYLPEDKFEQLVKKNPDLAIFKQKFNLDFE